MEVKCKVIAAAVADIACNKAYLEVRRREDGRVALQGPHTL